MLSRVSPQALTPARARLLFARGLMAYQVSLIIPKVRLQIAADIVPLSPYLYLLWP